MDLKTFLNSPVSSLSEIGYLPGDQRSIELLGLAESLTEEKQKLKALKKEKAEVARLFKTVHPDTHEHAALMAAMKHVSHNVKHCEDALKRLEKTMSGLLTRKEPAVDISTPPFVQLPAVQAPTEDYIIRELQENEWNTWYEFIARHTTSAYHQPAWPDIIRQSFGHPTRIWIAESKEGEILGGVPLIFFSSKLFGHFAVSIPYFNYGGIVAEGAGIARSLITYLKDICIQEKLSHIEVRTMQDGLGENFSNKKVSMVLPLPLSNELLELQLGAKVRAQYRKAEEHQPVIRFGKQELLDDFYRVFSRNMRDLGTPVYSKQWFANILNAETIRSQVVVVYVNGEAVSSGFLIGYGNMLEIPWASTIKKANAMNTNMWMYRHILGYAISEGYQFFDFGRSTRDAGTFKFKKQWGAEPYTHYWYYVFPEGGAVPGLNPDNPKYKLMIAVWKLLPVWLTTFIGPPIVANLP